MTNRDHSPSISQNDERDAKLRTEGSGLDLDALEKRYTSDPVPPCPVCGGPLSIARAGGGEATVWACPKATIRDPTPDHYERSRFTQRRHGDSDVLRLIQTQRELVAALSGLVEEFGGSIAQYHKLGPDWTHKDGTEVFEVSVLLDREPLIEAARATIANASPPPSAEPGEGGSGQTLEATKS